MRILLLEDDPMLSELLNERLSERNSVVSIKNGSEAMDVICAEKFDLFLLDVDVPGIDGFSLLELIRNANITTPAIFITAKVASKELKRGFEVGGNDYIKKPFDFDELEARIQNICKIYHIDSKIELGIDLFLDGRIIQMGQNRTHISAKEAQMLGYLVKNRARFVSYDELGSAVWTLDEAPSQATIRTYIKNLRHILGSNAIAGERGIGWRYDGI